MGIFYEEGKRIFYLTTKQTLYQMVVEEKGYLLHTYYGERADGEDFSYLITRYDRGFSGNPNSAEGDRTFSLDALPQEFPSLGAADYRTTGLELTNGDGSFAFEGIYEGHKIYSGAYKPEGMPGLRPEKDEDVQSLEITLKDVASGVKLILCYTVFEEKDVIMRAARLQNDSHETITITKLSSMSLDFLESGYDLIHFDGRHAMEREMHREPLGFGARQFGSVRGTSSHQSNPFFILCQRGADEDQGDCYGFSLIYSGNFQFTAEKDQYDQTRVTMGIHPYQFSWQLRPGESFATPAVALAFSSEGLTGLSHLYHDLYRRNLSSSPFLKRRRPVLINSWEAAYFDFDHDSLVKMAKEALPMGVNLFVLDDGWFGRRDNDDKALGDWEVNTRKLPKGLSGLAEEINALGMEFGLWVEPEMVSEDSELYRAHPDWCLSVPGRKGARGRFQMVLDLSRKEVQDFILDFMDRLLAEANITYIKWDMNRSLTDVYSRARGKEEQGTVFHRYVCGLYRILEELTGKWPQVLFEGCSGGGGRFDAGMLAYHPQIWCSDNTDAINRLKIQYGTSFGYPISAMGAHVSVCPNHQTGRVVPLKTRGITAMSGTFGYELDPTKLTEEEKKECGELTRKFDCYYDLIFYGDYYRLTNPYEEGEGFMAWEFADKEKKEALVSIVITDKEPNDAQRYLRLKGLKRDAKYRVEGLDLILSGQALMKAGIPVPRELHEYDSVQLHLTEQ